MVTFTYLMEKTISEWLQDEINDRGMTAAELARKSGVSAPQITRLLSGQRGVSELSLRAISEALGIPPEVAFRVAGFLPPVSEKTEDHDKLLYMYDQLDEERKKLAILMIKSLLSKD